MHVTRGKPLKKSEDVDRTDDRGRVRRNNGAPCNFHWLGNAFKKRPLHTTPTGRKGQRM